MKATRPIDYVLSYPNYIERLIEDVYNSFTPKEIGVISTNFLSHIAVASFYDTNYRLFKGDVNGDLYEYARIQIKEYIRNNRTHGWMPNDEIMIEFV